MLFAFKAPADNERGPRFMHEALAAIHQANHRRRPISFEYGCHDGCVGLYVRVGDEISPLVAGLVTAKYPNCRLELLDNEASLNPPLPSLCDVAVTDLRLTPDLFPILRHSQFEDISSATFADPIDALLRAIEPDEHTHARVEITVAPTRRCRHLRARKAVNKLNHSYFRANDSAALFYARTVMHPFLWPLGSLWGLRASRHTHRTYATPVDTTAGRHHEREDDVQAASDKVGGHLFDVRIRLYVYAAKGERAKADYRLRSIAGAFGSFTVSRLATFRMNRVHRSRRVGADGSWFLLSHEELATLWHPPTATVGITHLHATEFRELEAPPMINATGRDVAADGVLLGHAKHRSTHVPVWISREDRRRHLYVVGKTGMGKSTLLENLIVADIHAGRGVCLIDPHGDLADGVIACIPTRRTNDVVVFDPNDSEYAIAFNPLWCIDPDRRDLVADDVLSAFSKVYDLSQTPRLKDTLRNALYVLVEKQMTLLDLLLLLADERYRRSVLANIEDDLARVFWHSEFPSWNKAYRTEALSAVQNKVRPFLMNRKVRAIVGQRSRPLNLREIMDQEKVLIVNLSKGKLGEDNSSLLGALLVSGIQQAAMSRAEVPESERSDFHLCCDEFQNFTTSSFATILSEARKYRLNLTVAHQYLKQLDVRTADAVFGNVGSIIAFQVGCDDAELLAQQLAKHPGQLHARDLANLPKYTAYVRLLVNGLPASPFSMKTVPPVQSEQDRRQTVQTASRRQFAQPLEIVRQQISNELIGA